MNILLIRVAVPFNEQKERKRDKNGINTSKNLNLHSVHCYLLSCQSV